MIRLAYIGNIGATYDLKTVVKAVSSETDFTLDIAGSARIEAMCGRIRQHGYLAAGALECLLKTCDIGIIPMCDDSWVGLPNKLGDYARSGLRIVTSLQGETAALLRKYACGQVYAFGDSASFVKAVRSCCALTDVRLDGLLKELDATAIYDAYVRRVVELTHD